MRSSTTRMMQPTPAAEPGQGPPAPPVHHTAVAARPPAAVGSWQVVRAWPRSHQHALLELDTPSGPRGGQWYARRQDLHQALAQTPGAELIEGVLLHPQGTDAKLPAMAERLALGEQIVVHRPGRRAVLRAPAPGAPFTKVTRRRRAAAAIERHQAVAQVTGGLARVATVLDAGRDWFTLSALPGRTLLDLGGDALVPAHLLAGGWARLGAALAQLHATGPRDCALQDEHDAYREYRTTMGWLEPVQHWQLLPGAAQADLQELLAPLATQAPGPVGLLHRDLHDQQVLFEATAGGGQLSLLDLDTAAWGEAALDVANVLAHLQLRVRQGLLTSHRAAIAEQAFWTGLEPSSATRQRVGAYQIAAQLRLCAVYALRPRWRSLACQWFTELFASRYR